jgi:hypothetical protein
MRCSHCLHDQARHRRHGPAALGEGRLGLADPVERFLPQLGGRRVAVLTERVLAGQGPIETVPVNRSITVLDLMRHTSCPASVSAGTEVAAGWSGGGLSAATLTARFGVAGDIPRRFAAPAAIASRLIVSHAITESGR